MEPLRQEVKNFVVGCEHLLSLGSAQDLSPQESDLTNHYLSEVENLLYGHDHELGMPGTDAA